VSTYTSEDHTAYTASTFKVKVSEEAGSIKVGRKNVMEERNA